MKILLVKLSSMGDIFHTYPAISDLARMHPDAELSWLVDQNFAEIAGWHPFVKRVISLPLRNARKEGGVKHRAQLRAALTQVKSEKFDLVIDAQGLWKSSLLALRAKGERHGFDFNSIRERPASLFYNRKWRVSRDLHAIERVRSLFAHAIGYDLENLPIAGLSAQDWPRPENAPKRYAIVFPFTTWETKHWLDAHWRKLLAEVSGDIPVMIGWGSAEEQAGAKNLASGIKGVETFKSRMSLADMAAWIANAEWIVGMDTGFVHLADAMGKPVLGLFGPTDPDRSGACGANGSNLNIDLHCMPCHKKTCSNQNKKGEPKCMAGLTPEIVDAAIRERIAG